MSGRKFVRSPNLTPKIPHPKPETRNSPKFPKQGDVPAVEHRPDVPCPRRENLKPLTLHYRLLETSHIYSEGSNISGVEVENDVVPEALKEVIDINNRLHNRLRNNGARTKNREMYLRSNIAPTLEALDAKEVSCFRGWGLEFGVWSLGFGV